MNQPAPSPPHVHAPAPRKQTSPVVVVLLVAGALLGTVVLGGGLMYALFIHEIEKPVTAADRAVVLTADDLLPLVDGLEVKPERALLKKVGYLDGSSEVSYEYDDTSDEDFPLYVMSSISYEPKASDARMVYGAMDLGLSIGLKVGGDDQLTRRECPFSLSLGKQSKCSQLLYGGALMGIAVSVLEGRRVLFFNVSGVQFDDAEPLRELLEPKVAAARGWKP